MQVYDNPEFYDIAFSHRDIPAEVNFIEQVIARYSHVPVRTILELASGNSPHMQELCVRGYSYVGLEFNERMVAYSRGKVARDHLRAMIFQGDMTDFTLPSPVDCVLVLLSSFYVQNDEELYSHLKSVARVLRPGGLYILDGVVSYFPEDIGTYVWTESRDGVVVDVEFDMAWLDEGKGLVKRTIILDVNQNGKKHRLQHGEVRKVYPAAQFIESVEKTGDWQYIDAFSDFDIDTKPNPDGRSVAILRRT
jgi:SAM-dependent methyltransferase